MKLDYLHDGSPECPLLRLFAFTPEEAGKLAATVRELSKGGSPIPIHALTFVEAIGGCQLTLHVTGWDQGVTRGSVPHEFICGFTPGTWDNVAGLVEAFNEHSTAFQWLAGVPGDVGLLLSVSGQW